jgi:sRNA-binding carbon storage regulator CsrA
MLVLSRKNQEKVNLYIGDRKLGEVFFLGLGNHGARLGFRFGPEIRIEREEIADRENTDAKE